MATGAVGELLGAERGSVVPAAQADDAAVPAGWFRTGDMVSADDDGYLYPAGRLSDTINRGGEKFAPSEVEEVVRPTPLSATWPWWACPIPRWGTGSGVAAVVAEPLDLDELRDFCTGRIANFKLPERLLVVDEIPYNDFGKVDRKELRARFGRAGPVSIR